MAVSPELKALLKLAGKAHPRLQAMMVDLHLYRPRLVEAAHQSAPPELHLHDAVDWEPDADLEEAAQLVQTALATPAQLPVRSRFKSGPAIHVQFDGGSTGGVGTGGFVIVDSQGVEVVRAGKWFGNGLTNNEAEALACREAIACLARLQQQRPELRLPARVFGDSQLMIRFLTGVYKKPGKASIYEAL